MDDLLGSLPVLTFFFFFFFFLAAPMACGSFQTKDGTFPTAVDQVLNPLGHQGIP